MLGLTALIPLLAQVLPSLIPIFATPAAGNVLIKGAEIAERIFGTHDPSQIEAQIKTDQALLDKYRAELEHETASDVAFLADIQSARNMQVEAVKAGSRTQWMPVLITAMIFGIFFMSFYLTVMERIATNNVAAQQMVGAIIAAFTGAWGFWLGSSRSSQSKDNVIASITATAAQQSQTAATVADTKASSGRMFR
jgi:hypothetical protein